MSLDDEWDQSGVEGRLLANRYRVIRKLHEGPRSDVFEAEHVERAEHVALKVLRAHPASAQVHEHVRKRGQLERFGHRGIVEVTDLGIAEGGQLFVVSELVRGIGASSEARTIGQRRALAIVRQVLEAVAVAHESGVVHRDLNPEHIMIARGEGDTDLVRVLGFGLARLNRATARTFADPSYMPPEHVLGGRTGPPADLYSAGAVLFELLTGHAVFHAKNARALMRLHAYAPLQTLKQRAPEWSFTDETESLVARALAKRPDHRYGSAGEMIDAVDAAIRSVEKADAAAVATLPSAPRSRVDDSIFLMAHHPSAPVNDPGPPPVVPFNVERTVPALPWTMRARKRLRKLVATLRGLDRRYQLAIAGFAALLVIVIVVALVARGDDSTAADQVDVKQNQLVDEAGVLLDEGQPKQAIDLLARELRPNARVGERLAPTLARVIAAGDADAAVAALDLASQLAPVPVDLVVEQASTADVVAVRHRAAAIAAKHGFADRIDRVQSWSLDLEDATSCAAQRELIERLAGSGDRRAIPALRKARRTKCVAEPARAAIIKLEGAGAKN